MGDCGRAAVILQISSWKRVRKIQKKNHEADEIMFIELSQLLYTDAIYFFFVIKVFININLSCNWHLVNLWIIDYGV